MRQETPAEKIRRCVPPIADVSVVLTLAHPPNRLEGYRAGLVRRKTELELKIAGLEEQQSHRTE